MATICENKPWVRYVMTTNEGDSLNLYCSTSLNSRKVKQIKENPYVHITLGWEDPANPSPYVQIAAKAKIKTDQETKEKHWVPMYEQYFKTPDNPDYCVLEFVPEYIEVWGYGVNMLEPLILEFSKK